jgi:hypothetical protein
MYFARSNVGSKNILPILKSIVILRRSRDGHPRQAERVDGGRRGFAQDDSFAQIQDYLIAVTVVCLEQFDSVKIITSHKLAFAKLYTPSIYRFFTNISIAFLRFGRMAAGVGEQCIAREITNIIPRDLLWQCV